MEQKADNFVALIGRPSVVTTNCSRTAVSDMEKTRNWISDDVAFQSTPSTSVTASTFVDSAPDSSLRNAENGPCSTNGSRSTVHNVVVDVEPSSVNGFKEELDNEDEQRTPQLLSLSRMRRSEACYDIAMMSSSSPINVQDSPCRASSKSLSPLPSSAPMTSAMNDTETEPIEDLFSEEEKALKYLDAIAYDYVDHEEIHEPTDKRVSKL